MDLKDWIPAGAVIVSVATWFVNSGLERRRKNADRRAEAYIDYLTGLSRASNFPDKSAKEWYDANILMLEARHRIVLYGSPKVMDALRKVHEGPRYITQGDGRQRYSSLIQAMQKDLSGRSSAEQEILLILVEAHPENGERTHGGCGYSASR